MVMVRVLASTKKPERLVCLAARGDYLSQPPWTMSFAQVMKGVRGKTEDDRVRKLINTLLALRHWGPFEHPTITLGFEGLSRVGLAQLTRHRLVTFDIQSARTVSLKGLTPSHMVWPPGFVDDEVRSRERGRQKVLISKDERKELISEHWRQEMVLYQKLLSGNVPKEDARYILSLGIPVHGTMTLNARSMMHVVALRSFGDVQWEMRDFASKLLAIGKTWMPITFSTFEKMMKDRSIIGP